MCIKKCVILTITTLLPQAWLDAFFTPRHGKKINLVTAPPPRCTRTLGEITYLQYRHFTLYFGLFLTRDLNLIFFGGNTMDFRSVNVETTNNAIFWGGRFWNALSHFILLNSSRLFCALAWRSSRYFLKYTSWTEKSCTTTAFSFCPYDAFQTDTTVHQ